MTICSLCGEKVRKLNPHRMDKHKVDTLEMLAAARVSGNEWVKGNAGSQMQVGREKLRAPYRTFEHCARLSWFGLAEHGPRRSGAYRITSAGLSFLAGKLSVPAIIYCKDGTVREVSEARVFVSQVKNVVLDETYWASYWQLQIYPTGEDLV